MFGSSRDFLSEHKTVSLFTDWRLSAQHLTYSIHGKKNNSYCRRSFCFSLSHPLRVVRFYKIQNGPFFMISKLISFAVFLFNLCLKLMKRAEGSEEKTL